MHNYFKNLKFERGSRKCEIGNERSENGDKKIEFEIKSSNDDF
jgi:hypothetical protein